MTALVEMAERPSQMLRLPRPDGPPTERSLAEANRRGREDSLRVLGHLLAGFDLPAMTQRVDGGTLQVGHASAELERWFDGAALLDRLVGVHDLGGPRMKLLKDTARVETGLVLDQLRPESLPTARAVAGPLAVMLDQGHTAVFDGIDFKDGAPRRFAEHVERVFGCRININGYLSLRPHQSFGAHWDDHEVVIMQLLGHKRWEVHEPAALSPHQAVFDLHTTGKVVWDDVIDPGTVLHLPRGWGHNVTGVDELTFHLTVTIPRVSVLNVVDGALGLLHRDPRSYRFLDASLGAGPPATAELHDLLTDALGEGAVDDVMATRAANVAGRATQRFSHLRAALYGETPLSELWVRAPHPGGIVLGDEVDDRTYLVFAKRTARLTGEALELIAPLLDGRAHRAAVAEARAPAGTGRQVVEEALRAGLLEVVADPHLPGITLGDAYLDDGAT